MALQAGDRVCHENDHDDLGTVQVENGRYYVVWDKGEDPDYPDCDEVNPETYEDEFGFNVAKVENGAVYDADGYRIDPWAYEPLND